jgi:dihydroxyacetone synthase
MAIAGHLKLDNLCLLYDNNQITCDGPLDWIVSEDTNAKMRAMGWEVMDIFDGDTSVESIVAALKLAKSYKDKPTFINIRTTIGFGMSTAGTFKAHHGLPSEDDVARYAEFSGATAHTVSKRTKAIFQSKVTAGKALEQEWNAKVELYKKLFPEEGKLLNNRLKGIIEYEDLLTTMQAPEKPLATREFNGTVFKKLFSNIPNVFAGGADLWNSNQLGNYSNSIFDASNRAGQVVRYGIREHAMASVANGLAAYSPGAILPVTATFFMFYLYAAPGVRMGALSNLKVIHVATHDTVGEGQNGPTHQPVELDSLYRAMPNMLYIRPSDGEEVIGAWLAALGKPADGHSVIMSLARDPAITIVPNTDRQKVLKGGYVIVEKENALVTLISCGSELQFAVEAASQLSSDGTLTRVVSMPCIRLFEAQSEEYQDSVLSTSLHVISVEAYVSMIWARFCTASIAMDSFGYSGAGRENFARFGLDDAGIVRKVKAHVEKGGKSNLRRRWTLLK